MWRNSFSGFLLNGWCPGSPGIKRYGTRERAGALLGCPAISLRENFPYSCHFSFWSYDYIKEGVVTHHPSAKVLITVLGLVMGYPPFKSLIYWTSCSEGRGDRVWGADAPDPD